jgi:hypothetical protein
VTGLVAKEPKARRKAGLIAMLQTVKVATNHVVDLTEKKEANTHHVDQPRAHVRKKEKANLGVKKQQKEKRNEIN